MKVARFAEEKIGQALIMMHLSLPEGFGDDIRVEWHKVASTSF